VRAAGEGENGFLQLGTVGAGFRFILKLPERQISSVGERMLSDEFGFISRSEFPADCAANLSCCSDCVRISCGWRIGTSQTGVSAPLPIL